MKNARRTLTPPTSTRVKKPSTVLSPALGKSKSLMVDERKNQIRDCSRSSALPGAATEFQPWGVAGRDFLGTKLFQELGTNLKKNDQNSRKRNEYSLGRKLCLAHGTLIRR